MRSRHDTGILGWIAGLLAEHIPEELDTIENAGRSSAPAVMVLSQQDRVVPFDLQCRVSDAYFGPRRSLVLTGANHGDPPTQNELGEFKVLTRWLWDNMENERKP